MVIPKKIRIIGGCKTRIPFLEINCKACQKLKHERMVRELGF